MKTTERSKMLETAVRLAWGAEFVYEFADGAIVPVTAITEGCAWRVVNAERPGMTAKILGYRKVAGLATDANIAGLPELGRR